MIIQVDILNIGRIKEIVRSFMSRKSEIMDYFNTEQSRIWLKLSFGQLCL